MKKTILSITFIFLITLSGCGETTNNTGATADSGTQESSSGEVATSEVSSDNSMAVKIEILQNMPVQDEMSFVGLIKPSEEINVNARAEGTVSKIYFQEGQVIKKGDIIADLRDPQGENNAQINLEISQNNLENARNNLHLAQERSTQNIRNAEIALEASQQRLADTEETLNKTKTQSELIITSANTQLDNAQNSYNRLQTLVDLKKAQLGLSNDSIVNSSNIALDNTYNALELALFATLPSVFTTLDNLNLPRGLSSLENDLEDLQDDLDDIRRNDINDLQDLIYDVHDFIIDLSEYLGDEDVQAAAPTSIPTITATVQGIGSQMQSLNSALGNVQNSLNSLEINHSVSIQTLLDQLESTKDALRLQELALQNSQTQVDLSEFSLSSSINQLRKDVESKVATLELAKISSRQDVDNAENQVKNLELQLKQSDIQESYLQVESPVDGIVSNVNIEKGQLVYNRDIVIQVYNPNKKEIEIQMTAKEVSQVKVGSKTTATLRNDDKKISGTITEIAPTASASTHLVPVTITLDENPEIFIPNAVVEVDIPVTLSANKLYIPLKSVLVRESGNYVFVVENNKTVKKMVEIGKILGSKVAIENGLKAGDMLIVEGQRTIEEGMSVDITEEQA